MNHIYFLPVIHQYYINNHLTIPKIDFIRAKEGIFYCFYENKKVEEFKYTTVLDLIENNKLLK